MDVYYNPRDQRTEITIRDVEMALDPQRIVRQAQNEIIDRLVREGLNKLQRPSVIAVRRGGRCFIPRKKRK